MQNRKTYVIGIVAIMLLMFTFFYQMVSIPLFDSDFWWHIATGRHIIHTGALPDTDPFSFVSTLDENKNLHPLRENFILKQYWLGQILFYFIYENTGSSGIILLRALLLTLTIGIVFWRLKRWNMSLPVSFLAIFILCTVINRSTGERPVLFTIFFTPLVFFILEEFKAGKKRGVLFSLLPVMLLWPNLHGGFIIGVIMILVFMIGEGIKILLKKSDFSRKEAMSFFTILLLALGASWVNPTGWDVFVIAFSSKYIPFTQGIQEYQSPIFYHVNRLYPPVYGYVALVVLFPLLLFFRNRRFDITHIILLTGLLYMSLTASRFIAYYATVAVMVFSREIDLLISRVMSRRLSRSMENRVSYAMLAACLLSAVFFASGYIKFQKIHFGLSTSHAVPQRAVNFIEDNDLTGNIFNDFAYGGYLTWRLYPQKTFIDTRALNLTVMSEYYYIGTSMITLSGKDLSPGKLPLWERLLEHYNIDVVFLSLFDVYGDSPRIISSLLESDNWTPIFSDPLSVIFVKNVPQFDELIEKHAITDDTLNNMIVYSASLHAMRNRMNRHFLITLGEAFYRMGKLDNALTAYRYAQKRLPHPHIQEMIDKIESELETVPIEREFETQPNEHI